MTPPRLALNHVALYVRSVERMRDFYTRVLGFVVTDTGHLGGTELVFMSRDPRDHHQLALASGRPASAGTSEVLNQLSFRLESLGDLRALHAAVSKEPDVTDVVAVEHGIAWSIYFRDPEGNRIEAFVDTPWYVHQPRREPIDLSLSDAELTRRTEEAIRRDPSFAPVERWRVGIAEVMGKAGA